MLLDKLLLLEYPEREQPNSSIPSITRFGSLLIEEALKRSQTEDDAAVSRWLANHERQRHHCLRLGNNKRLPTPQLSA